MNSESTKLLTEALLLPSSEREALAGRLFESLESDDPDAESAWQAEVERRIADLDHSQGQTVPWTEARRLIFGDVNDQANS